MQGESVALAQGRASITTDPPNAPPRLPASAWRDLRLRTASALVVGPLGLAVLWFGGTAWQWLIALLTVGMAAEWWNMCGHRAVPRLLRIATGASYILPGFISIIWLREDATNGFHRTLFVVFVVWSSDIGAYLAGRLFGGPKLAPRISPGKTRSGAAGGLLCAMSIGLIAAAITPGGHLISATLIAGLIGIASQFGDLLESALKRYFGVKDSGKTIPGHGGLLDRLDGMLLAAPVAAIVLLVSGEGVFWR